MKNLKLKYHALIFPCKWLIALTFGLISFHTFAQDEVIIRPFIETGDLKKLVKADAFCAEADKLMDEVNRLNSEILSLQGDASLRVSKMTRKTEALQTRALKNTVRASALLGKCNEQKYWIYKMYLDNFWKVHEGEEANFLNAKLMEELAGDSYFHATNSRNEAKRINDSKERVKKLAEADNFGLDAIRKQLLSLGECYGITTEPEPPVPLVGIEPPDTGAGNESLAEVVLLSPETVAPDTTLTDEKVLLPETETLSVPSLAEASMLPAGLVFRIQVAENPGMLRKEQLTAIYRGRYPVEEVFEEGWYKYQLLGVRNYSDATAILGDIAAGGAFIVAYEDGIKLDLDIAINKNRDFEQAVKAGGGDQVQEVEFHVQLAASRTPLSPETLAGIYRGKEPVVVIHEDGWYKYHLKAGYSAQVARGLLKNCGVTGAFIVSYRRAAKK